MASQNIVASGYVFPGEGINCGPFQSSGGDHYVLLLVSGASPFTIDIFKRTDPLGGTWTAQDTSNNPSLSSDERQVLVAAFQVGDVLHIVISGDEGENDYISYDMSSDTWGTQATVHDVARAATRLNRSDIVVRSDGDLIVLCHDDDQSNMGVGYNRVGYSVNTGSGWSAMTEVSDAVKNEVHYAALAACIGSDGTNDDLTHFFWMGLDGSSDQINHRTLTSADSLGTAGDTNGNLINSDPANCGNAVAFDRGGTTKIRLGFKETVSGDLEIINFDHATAPTYGALQDTGGQVDAASGPTICLAVLEEALYAFYIDNATSDLYTANDQGSDSWTTPAAEDTTVAGKVSGQFIDRNTEVMFAFLNSGPDYHENANSAEVSTTALSALNMPQQHLRIGPFEV